jgi:hypothetical protein
MTIQPVKPNLNIVLDSLKDNIFYSLNCHRVGIIQAFDSVKQTATITLVDKMVLSAFNQNDNYKDFAPLVDCPVIIYGNKEAWIDTPIAVGDECLVLFNDRDIDNWYKTGTTAAPLTNRTHDFSDAIAIVGLHSSVKAINGFDNSAFGLRYKNAKIIIKSNGKVSIVNQNGSLFNVLNNTLTALISSSVLDGATKATLQTAKQELLLILE